MKPITRQPKPRTLPRVHVVAFEPKPENDGAVGGFDWFYKPADADKRVAKAKRAKEHATDEVYRFDVAVRGKTAEAITEEIDRNLYALCARAARKTS